MKMELIEGSETSAIRTQTPGNYPKENILHIENGESLKSRIRHLSSQTRRERLLSISKRRWEDDIKVHL